MRSRWIRLISLALAVLPSTAVAGSWFDVSDGRIVWGDWSFDSWALEWPDAFGSDRDTLAILSILRGWNSHGVNALLVSAQTGQWSLYARDGQPVDASAKRYKTVLETARFHLVPTVVNLFSARPADGLNSPDAYRTAAATAVRCLPADYYGVLVVGDVVSGERWGDDHPFPLNKSANVIELCREIRKRSSSVLLGVPADILPGAPHEGDRRPLIYAAKRLDAMEKLIGQLSKPDAGPLPADLAKDILVFTADRLLRRSDAGASHDAAIQAYLRRVETERLAVRAPAIAASRPAGADAEPLTAEEKADGWVALFDGRSFEGWTTLRPDWGAWHLEDGCIVCGGSRMGPWLRTRRRFGSFVLRLQFKISEKGNSGVFVRAPLDGRASRFGFEIQIMGRRLEKLDDHSSTGAIYASLPPKEDASRPVGEWNNLEIICQGASLRVLVNGRIVQDVDTRDVDVLKDRLREGVIGLQDHGDKAWFRKIRIKELPSAIVD